MRDLLRILKMVELITDISTGVTCLKGPVSQIGKKEIINHDDDDLL